MKSSMNWSLPETLKGKEKEILNLIDRLMWIDIPAQGPAKVTGRYAEIMNSIVMARDLTAISHYALDTYDSMPFVAIRNEYDTGYTDFFVLADSDTECTLLLLTFYELMPKLERVEEWIRMAEKLKSPNGGFDPKIIWDKQQSYICLSIPILHDSVMSKRWTAGDMFFHKNICFVPLRTSETSYYLFHGDQSLGVYNFGKLILEGLDFAHLINTLTSIDPSPFNSKKIPLRFINDK